MKKSILFLLVLSMLLGLCACGSKKPVESSGMPNPVHECTKEELGAATGIFLDAPEGATDVSYFYIDSADAPISQVFFKLDGKEFCYRAQPTSYTSITATVSDAVVETTDLMDSLNKSTNIGASLAGMYGDWEMAALVDVAGSREGVVALNDGKAGFISWLDVVPGVLYSLSVDKKASQPLLMDTAELCFVPLQGDA